MTDVRAKLAEALRPHFWWFVGNLGVPGMPDQKGYRCSCGWEQHGDDADPLAHQADVLLSLEGVAIVALPTLMVDRSNVAESIKDRPMWQVEDAWTCLELADRIEYEAAGQNVFGTLTVTEARALAAALLAAADAAEAVKQ